MNIRAVANRLSDLQYVTIWPERYTNCSDLVDSTVHGKKQHQRPAKACIFPDPKPIEHKWDKRQGTTPVIISVVFMKCSQNWGTFRMYLSCVTLREFAITQRVSDILCFWPLPTTTGFHSQTWPNFVSWYRSTNEKILCFFIIYNCNFFRFMKFSTYTEMKFLFSSVYGFP